MSHGVLMGSQESRHETEDFDEDEPYNFKPFVSDTIVPESSDETPNPRSGHRIACDEDNFYSYGGYNPLNEFRGAAGGDDVHSLFRELWKFNFASMKWKKLDVSDIPFSLASNALILSGKVLMVYGGTGVPFHLQRSNHLYTCNLKEDKLRFKRVITTGNAPQPLYGQAVFLKDNYFYTVGGTTGHEYYTDIHRLNLTTNVWEEVYTNKGMRDEPHGRYRHELAVVGNNVYVLGGGIGSEAYEFIEIPVFNLEHRVWDVVRTIKDDDFLYPVPRQYHSAVNVPGTESFIIVGGVSQGSILDDAWKLDISTLCWKKITSLQLLAPVYFHASSITPSGKMYTFGGVSENFFRQIRVSHIQCAWVCIPKLKDIAWEAVLHYDLFGDLTATDFKQLGLPKQYYDKLSDLDFFS